jgi:hypothetical protein
MGGKLVFHIKGKQYAILIQNVQKSKCFGGKNVRREA